MTVRTQAILAQEEEGAGVEDSEAAAWPSCLHSACTAASTAASGPSNPSHPSSCPCNWHMGTRTKGRGCICRDSPVSGSPHPRAPPGRLRLAGFGNAPGGDGRGLLGPAVHRVLDELRARSKAGLTHTRCPRARAGSCARPAVDRTPSGPCGVRPRPPAGGGPCAPPSALPSSRGGFRLSHLQRAGAGEGPRPTPPTRPEPGSPGGTEQWGPSGRRRGADNGSGACSALAGAPGAAGTGGRAMSPAAGRPAVRRAGRGEQPLRAPRPVLGPAMRSQG